MHQQNNTPLGLSWDSLLTEEQHNLFRKALEQYFDVMKIYPWMRTHWTNIVTDGIKFLNWDDNKLSSTVYYTLLPSFKLATRFLSEHFFCAGYAVDRECIDIQDLYLLAQASVFTIAHQQCIYPFGSKYPMLCYTTRLLTIVLHQFLRIREYNNEHIANTLKIEHEYLKNKMTKNEKQPI